MSIPVDGDSDLFSHLASAAVPASAPEALARAVRQRRAELRLSQEDVRRASGLSVTTIGKIERGDAQLTVQTATLRRLDLALQWPVGTCESWYEGRGGVITPAPSGSSSEPLTLGDISALVPMVLQALEERSGVEPISLMVTMARFEPKLRRALERALVVLADELERS